MLEYKSYMPIMMHSLIRVYQTHAAKPNVHYILTGFDNSSTLTLYVRDRGKLAIRNTFRSSKCSDSLID